MVVNARWPTTTMLNKLALVRNGLMIVFFMRLLWEIVVVVDSRGGQWYILVAWLTMVAWNIAGVALARHGGGSWLGTWTNYEFKCCEGTTQPYHSPDMDQPLLNKVKYDWPKKRWMMQGLRSNASVWPGFGEAFRNDLLVEGKFATMNHQCCGSGDGGSQAHPLSTIIR